MSKSVQKVYKIYNPKTGLYSKGGTSASNFFLWSKGGKMWNGIGPLKNHLRLCSQNGGREVLKQYIKDECVIHEFTLTVESAGQFGNVQDIVDKME